MTITDLTRMSGRRVCLAGYVKAGCVRVVLPADAGYMTEDWLYLDDAQIIKPFSVVELDFVKKETPDPPHTEDWIINPAYRAVKQALAAGERVELLARTKRRGVDDIFGAKIKTGPGWYIEHGEGDCSLGTIHVGEITTMSTGSNQIGFIDRTGREYLLRITDLTFRKYVDFEVRQNAIEYSDLNAPLLDFLATAKVFLRIGLVRGDWEKFPGRCYLQVNGIYSFPDYLDGRSFADFCD